MLAVPRSVVLAAWGGALAAGAAVPAAHRAITGSDEPHAVVPAPAARAGSRGPLDPSTATLAGAGRARVPDPAPGPGAARAAEALERIREATDLGALLGALAGSGLRVRAVLPAPGDPAGLAGPPSLTAHAVDAGEAVLVDGGPDAAAGEDGLALVPDVEVFGSLLEPGATVSWRVHPARVGPGAEATTLEGASRGLRTAVARASALLEDMNVARWRDDAADALADVRGGALPRDAFPPAASAQAVGTATTAARVLLLADLAGADEGGTFSLSQARARRAVVAEVGGVARAALAAAASSTWSPGPV